MPWYWHCNLSRNKSAWCYFTNIVYIRNVNCARPTTLIFDLPIGSGIILSPIRCQYFTETNVEIPSIGPPEIWRTNWNFSLNKMHLKMSSETVAILFKPLHVTMSQAKLKNHCDKSIWNSFFSHLPCGYSRNNTWRITLNFAYIS